MAYVVPSMPSAVNIWTNGVSVLLPPRVVTTGQLRFNPALTGQNYVGLLLPAGTDIRGQYHSSGRDTVECPAGSGRFYRCNWMDDTALGFTNVHRQAVLEWLTPFITPTP